MSCEKRSTPRAIELLFDKVLEEAQRQVSDEARRRWQVLKGEELARNGGSNHGG